MGAGVDFPAAANTHRKNRRAWTVYRQLSAFAIISASVCFRRPPGPRRSRREGSGSREVWSRRRSTIFRISDKGVERIIQNPALSECRDGRPRWSGRRRSTWMRCVSRVQAPDTRRGSACRTPTSSIFEPAFVFRARMISRARAGQADLGFDIEQERQIGPITVAHQIRKFLDELERNAAAVTLIRHGCMIEAVADHHLAAFERRNDFFQ